MAYNIDLNILKIITTENGKATEFAELYSDSMFSSKYRKFGKFFLNYVQSYKALPTERVLIDANQKEETYIKSIFNEIESHKYDPKEYNYDLNKIKRRYALKALKEMRGKIEAGLGESGDEDSVDLSRLVSDTEKTLYDIKSLDGARTYEQKSINNYVEEFRRKYKAIKENPELGQGILTRYSGIDYATNGIRPTELMIVFGESGAGKSMLLNNIGINMWLQGNWIDTPKGEYSKGHNVIYFSLEMPYADCFNRTLASLADVPHLSLERAALTQEEEDRVNYALDFIENYPYKFQIIDIPRGATVEQAELRYIQAKSEFDPEIAIFDYLGIMEATGISPDESDWLKQSHIAGQLHEFGRAYNVATLTASQLTTMAPKDKKDRENMVGHHRINRSKGIIHHANFGLQIVTRLEEKNYPDMELEFIKNRKGPKPCLNLKRNFANARVIDIKYNPPTESQINDGDISNKVAEISKKNS